MAGLIEAFPSRFPSEILAEIQRLPTGLLDEILEVKAYKQAKSMTDAADTTEARKRLPDTPLFHLVSEIDMDLAAEEVAKRRQSVVVADGNVGMRGTMRRA